MSNEKDNLKRENTIRFIEAAEELIDEYGIENVSVRKIAEKAGFHNSTIYLYFTDSDQLLLLASLKHFNEYSRALSRLSTKDFDSKENFYFIWRFFIESMYRKPHIFYNFFFGKHSDDLTKIMRQYYDLFPDKDAEFSPVIEDMYYGKNIQQRCLRILLPLVDLDNRVTAENLGIINDIIVSSLKYKLEQKCQNPELDSDILTRELMQIIEHVIEK